MTRIGSLAFVCFVALVGCSPSADQNTSIQVMNAALGATSQAQDMVTASVSATGGQFSGDVANRAGGSAHVSGSAAQSGSGWTTTFDLAFAHWIDPASQLTIDGSLHEGASFSSLDPPVGSSQLSGMLHATGAKQADVDFDLTVTYSLTGYEVSGSIGGNSVHVSSNVRPR